MANPPPAFREGLASLSPARFAEFVAAVWRARGRTVTADGGVLRVTDRPGGEERRLYPLAAASAEIPDEVDVVVAADPDVDLPAATEVLGPGDLYTLVRYGVDRPTSDDLLSTYVDPSLVADRGPGPEAPAGHGADQDTDATSADPTDSTVTNGDGGNVPSPSSGEDSSARRRAVLLAGGAALVGLGAGLGTLVASSGDHPTAEPTQNDSASPEVSVPGLAATGVSDPATLATAHVDRLHGTAYTLAATQTVRGADGRLRSSLSLEVALDADRSFLTRVATSGPDAPAVIGEPPAHGTYWSDRETYLRRVTDAVGTRLGPYEPRRNINDWYFWSNIVPWGGQPYSTLSFLTDLFQAVPTTVTPIDAAEGSGYRLLEARSRIEPSPIFFNTLDNDSPATRFTLVATVEPLGLVRDLFLRYRGLDHDEPVDVRWSVEYSGLGTTAVERPDWYAAAVEATRT